MRGAAYARRRAWIWAGADCRSAALWKAAAPPGPCRDRSSRRRGKVSLPICHLALPGGHASRPIVKIGRRVHSNGVDWSMSAAVDARRKPRRPAIRPGRAAPSGDTAPHSSEKRQPLAADALKIACPRVR